MNPGKKITKKQIKEDKLVTSAFKVSEYIQKNPTSFVIGGSAALVIFAVIVLFFWNSGKKNSEADVLFGRAHLSVEMGQIDGAISDLLTIVNSYANTPVAPMACYTLANMYFETKDYDNASTYFKLIVSRYNIDKMILAGAAAGAAACGKIKGDYQEAGSLYRQAADLYPDEMWSPNYLLQAGKNYTAAADTASAISAYEALTANYSRTVEANSAKRTLAELKY